jgi:L-serine kinase (ATP) / ParB family transcriptional regulator, heme-responsive regulator
MSSTMLNVPTPELRILDAKHIHPHEEHDSQRSTPLIERLKQAEFLINPALIAPMPNGEYVILDGANRYHCFSALGYQHQLFQVMSYESGMIDLQVWQHVVSDWSADEFVKVLQSLPNINLSPQSDVNTLATLQFKDRTTLHVIVNQSSLVERNAILRAVVKIYQNHARLDRTSLTNPQEVWGIYPQAICLIRFEPYSPTDIMNSTLQKAYLPPGISRHLIQGRAMQLNYPLSALQDTSLTLEQKNADLQTWILQKFAQRAVRFYGESTYQFSE